MATERLVILPDREPETLRRLRSAFDITQSVSRRVFLARQEPSGLSAADLEGVRVFAAPDIPEPVLLGLDEKERLFVGAWRIRFEAKKRIGEGLNWDHPGFKPPR